MFRGNSETKNMSNVLTYHFKLTKFVMVYIFQVLVDELFQGVATRYMRMASAQFPKGFQKSPPAEKNL